MLKSLTLLVVFQLIGEVIARGAGLPLPGPVLGLVLFLLFLIAKRGPDPALEQTSRGLLNHLPLLFVPAGVGVVTQLDTVGREFVPILAALVLSTALSIAVTALVMVVLLKRAPASGTDLAKGDAP